jgi:voltage-gated potassium channel
MLRYLLKKKKTEIRKMNTDKTDLKNKVYRIIFESKTPAGQLYDILLIISILTSVTCVMLQTVTSIHLKFGKFLAVTEIFFTALYTLEYIVRLWCAPKPVQYAKSFFGVVDLLGVLPTYIGIFYPNMRFLQAIRILRTLRIFQILRLTRYQEDANDLIQAFRSSRRKITIFLLAILALVVILGSIMFMIEDAESGFTNIPLSIYWAIVTLTTVGYGDIAPTTPLGQAIASLIMIMGYCIIAVPTGIVTVQFAEEKKTHQKRICNKCEKTIYEKNAKFCSNCGTELTAEKI